MNTTEHIVESYFRLVRHCFTVTDVKVINGNNRQFDLLAFDKNREEAFHIEVAVTHQLNWQTALPSFEEVIDYKFLGKPRPKENPSKNTDVARGKSYLPYITKTYESFGINCEKLNRIICVWHIDERSEKVNEFLRNKEVRCKFPSKSLSFLFFRDEVMPSLLETVGKSNYDDDILRSFSLIREFQEQTKR